MEGFFKFDGFFFALLNRIANLFLLNLIFLVSCLPVFTIGAALSALYRVGLKSVDDAFMSVGKEYIKAFKENFKQGTALFLINGAFIGVLGSTLLFLRNVPMLYKLPLLLLLAIFCLYMSFPFAMQAYFENTVVNTIKSSVYLMLGHIAESILMFVEFFAILVLLPLFFPQSFVLLLSFGFSVVAYLQARTLKKIFEKQIDGSV